MDSTDPKITPDTDGKVSTTRRLGKIERPDRSRDSDLDVPRRAGQGRAPTQRPEDTRPVIIAGPSAGGKTTLIRMLLERFPGMFRTPISHTTRPPHNGEQDGVDYHFISKLEFLDMVSAGRFIMYFARKGHYYGTSKDAFYESDDSNIITVLEVQEIFLVRHMQGRGDVPGRYVFLAPPNLFKMEKRLRSRATEPLEEIRCMLSRVKLDFAHSCMHHQTILNDDVEVAFDRLCAFIWRPRDSSTERDMTRRERRSS